MKKLTTLTCALMLSASMVYAQSNNATATASGNHNSALIEQEGSTNTAEVAQSGNYNTAAVDQGIQGIDSNNDEAFVSQVGNNNNAELSSRDGYASSPAAVIYSVDQQGNFNDVRARAFNAPAEGDIEQIGNNNSVDLTQHTSDEMYAQVSQSGNFNSANIDQVSGADNSVLQASFAGNNNSLEITQSGGAWQKYVLDVTGSYNTVSGTQGAHDADQFAEISGDHNSFEFYQAKSSDAGISVSGNYNDITMMQEGMSNSVFSTVPWAKDGIVVNGSYNTVGVTQFSDNNTATLDVSGNSNNATIVQGAAPAIL